MKRQSKIASAMEGVPSFAARYELFVKRLRGEMKSPQTILHYSHHLSLLCLHLGRLPEEISGEEYTEYYNLLLDKKASGSHMKHAVFSVRKYFKVFGLECHLGANPPIPKSKTLPVVLSVPEVRELLRNTMDLRDKALIGINLYVVFLHYHFALLIIQRPEFRTDGRKLIQRPIPADAPPRTVHRTTYLVNEEGIIEKIFTPKEIKTKIHAEQILDYLKK